MTHVLTFLLPLFLLALPPASPAPEEAPPLLQGSVRLNSRRYSYIFSRLDAPTRLRRSLPERTNRVEINLYDDEPGQGGLKVTLVEEAGRRSRRVRDVGGEEEGEEEVESVINERIKRSFFGKRSKEEKDKEEVETEPAYSVEEASPERIEGLFDLMPYFLRVFNFIRVLIAVISGIFTLFG